MRTREHAVARSVYHRNSRSSATAVGLSGRLGNQHMQQLLRSRLIQAKLTVSDPDDAFEREADSVADQVMRTPESQIQRKCAKCDEEQLHRSEDSPAPAPTVDAATENAIGSLSGRGALLPEAVRSFMEPRFKADFSAVRVHTDAHAHQLARSVNAQAFTVGHHVVFGAGRYAPDTDSGKRLLAHELTHVVQQRTSGAAIQRFSSDDCNSAQAGKIRAALNHAKTMLGVAIARLTASPVSATTQTHFSNHFGGYGDWRRDIVVRNLRRDLSLLTEEDINFICESSCDGDRAYTHWIFGGIHICPVWFADSNLTEQAETLIHELHHWDPRRGHLDLGYHGNQKNVGTHWPIAVNNADSYSELTQDLFEGP